MSAMESVRCDCGRGMEWVMGTMPFSGVAEQQGWERTMQDHRYKWLCPACAYLYRTEKRNKE